MKEKVQEPDKAKTEQSTKSEPDKIKQIECPKTIQVTKKPNF